MSTQVHKKFKLFVGATQEDQGLGSLGDQVEEFAKDKAAKSIGVEFLEAAKKLVITLGYRDDEPAYPVTIRAENLGKLSIDNLSDVENKISQASQSAGDVICHEIYVTDNDDFMMVFLAKK